MCAALWSLVPELVGGRAVVGVWGHQCGMYVLPFFLPFFLSASHPPPFLTSHPPLLPPTLPQINNMVIMVLDVLIGRILDEGKTYEQIV